MLQVAYSILKKLHNSAATVHKKGAFHSGVRLLASIIVKILRYLPCISAGFWVKCMITASGSEKHFPSGSSDPSSDKKVADEIVKIYKYIIQDIRDSWNRKSRSTDSRY